MPSLFRFFAAVGLLGVFIYAGMFALATWYALMCVSGLVGWSTSVPTRVAAAKAASLSDA